MRTRRSWPVRLIIMVMMVLALATTSFAVLADDPPRYRHQDDRVSRLRPYGRVFRMPGH